MLMVPLGAKGPCAVSTMPLSTKNHNSLLAYNPCSSIIDVLCLTPVLLASAVLAFCCVPHEHFFVYIPVMCPCFFECERTLS